MSYTRSRTKILTTPGIDGDVAYLQQVINYNCQKRVKGHYVHPLDYSSSRLETTFFQDTHIISDPPYTDPQYASSTQRPVTSMADPDQGLYCGNDLARSTNKAYAKFVDAMKDSAQNANNVLEMKQSLGQIGSHVSSIAKSINAIRRGDVVGAGKALGISVSGNLEKRIKKRAKQAADRWLELHFGWEPLVQDIGSSIDILQGTGKSSSSFYQRIKVGAGFSGGTVSSYSNEGFGIHEDVRKSFRWKGGTRMAGKVIIENPNAALANQMGFVNPLSVAWEAVPFSFVADWFANVGQCLSAMTDFIGFQLQDGYTTTYAQTDYTYSLVSRAMFDGTLITDQGYGVKLVEIKRTGGITSPVFKLTPFKGFSPARGATAISLLVQQMGRL